MTFNCPRQSVATETQGSDRDAQLNQENTADLNALRQPVTALSDNRQYLAALDKWDAASGFVAFGELDGESYHLLVHRLAEPPIRGSSRVEVLVRQHDGDTLLASPVGPTYTVSENRPLSVLLLLEQKTSLAWVERIPRAGADT
jgi:hypothetical protein